MVMDIMVLVIFAGAVFLCMRRGFASTIINFFRCVASLVLGILFCDDLATFLSVNTEMDLWIYDTLQSFLAEKLPLPVPESLVHGGVSSFTTTILTIISFLLITLAVGLLTSLLNLIFSKNHNEGFLGKVDWFLGGILGIFTGVFYVYLFLALITPVTALLAPQVSQGLMDSFNESRIAFYLYENNLLLIIFQNFMK